MDFSLSPEQQQIRDEVRKLCVKFDDAYWLEKDRTGDFPHELHAALAAAGWLGIAMPEAYGGAGLGITEAVIMMQAIAESGAAMSGASAVHINIFGLQPVVVFGTDEQKRRMLPPLIGPEDLDFHRAGRKQNSHPRAHHPARPRQAQDRGAEPVLHRSRSQPGCRARDRQDGPPCRRFE